MQPAPPRTVAGEAVLGPTRFLDLLELRLGLPPVIALPGEALLSYQTCLQELDEGNRFYSRSFRVDALGVTRTLLDWRAQWYEAGWQGKFGGAVSARLTDMAAVEARARGRVPLSPGQRAQRITAALDEGLDPHIDRVVLHDRVSDFPAAWQHVLARLTTEIASSVTPAPAAPLGSDLRRIQETLIELTAGDEGVKRAPEQLAADNSVIVVRAISRDLSAQAIGEYLLKTQGLDDTVVVAEHDGIILDNAFERIGLPRAGFQHYSRFRAVAQVLKLSLGLLWQPINPHLLLQFLIHPVGPLPDHVRSTLAEAVAREPGVGGTSWREALDIIRDRMLQKFGRSEGEAATLLEEIRYWLESERFDPEAGAPLGTLVERTQRCTTWLARKLHATEDSSDIELFAVAQAQGDALIAALKSLLARGEHTVKRIILERLIDEVSGYAADPATFAQAGHVRATNTPAAISQTWRTVVWWDMAARVSSLSYAWSEAELRQLVSEGVALPSVDARIDSRMRSWLRPISNAQSQLILVIHDRDEGHHPLWSRLESLFQDFAETRIENSLLGAGSSTRIAALDIPTDELTLRPLPTPRRWWQLPGGSVIQPRPAESYSSLNKLIYYPHEWVLQYAAKLRRGRAADLASEHLLCGNLAHRLFENFFRLHPDWPKRDRTAAQAWLGEYLPLLIAREGALLCEPGSGVRREQVTTILTNAFARLLDHLQNARIETATAEEWLEVPFKDIGLRGAIDLVLRDTRGREIVLDVKWSGEKRRSEELAEGRYLQLAAYAYMRQRASKSSDWPYHAYFIVETGNVLAPDASVFPDAIEVPEAAGGIGTLWARASVAHDWRRAQLTALRIEVNAAGTEPTAESASPTNALETTIPPDAFDEFTWLTGWDEGA